MKRPIVAVLAVSLTACQLISEKVSPPEPSTSASKPATGPLSEGLALMEQGQFDDALAKFEQVTGAEGLYHQGLAWVKKSESAPLPTPMPAGPNQGAAAPVIPEFKAEELRAIELFEKAIAANPSYAPSYLAFAQMLAPHSTRRFEMAKSRRPVKGAPANNAELYQAETDISPERVLSLYRQAAQADPTAKAPVEALVRFANRIGRKDENEWALQEMIKRDREKPEPYILYGDFLANEKKDPTSAIEQYRQALIWRADDEAVRAKIADIYIAMGNEHLSANQYALAEARYIEAQKYITDKSSVQGIRIQVAMSRLNNIRHR